MAGLGLILISLLAGACCSCPSYQLRSGRHTCRANGGPQCLTKHIVCIRQTWAITPAKHMSRCRDLHAMVLLRTECISRVTKGRVEWSQRVGVPMPPMKSENMSCLHSRATGRWSSSLMSPQQTEGKKSRPFHSEKLSAFVSQRAPWMGPIICMLFIK